MAKAAPSGPTSERPAEPEPEVDQLTAALKRQSVVPVVENGRRWNPAKIPYYVDGVRVTREEYVERQREERKQAVLAELADIVAEESPNPPTPPADQATSKE